MNGSVDSGGFTIEAPCPAPDDADGQNATNTRSFATIEEALADLRDGKMVVVCDDADRENEGDLTLAAEFATRETINFMATHGRGLVCLALAPERCAELDLHPMVAHRRASRLPSPPRSKRARASRPASRRPTAPTPSRWP
jgi:hypothetical protein